MRFAVTLFEPVWSAGRGTWVPGKRPMGRSLSWPNLCRSLTHFRQVDVDDKRRLPAWSPTRHRAGFPRGIDGVEHVSCLVLDVDDGTEIALGRQPWMDVCHLVHTSWSHQPEAPRWRLVVPLAAPVPARLWPRTWAWAQARSGGIGDPACKDPSRIYFVPAVGSKTWPRFASVHDGPLLRVPPMLPPTPEEVAFDARRRELASREPPVSGRPDTRARQLTDRLKTSEEARRKAAEALHARVSGEGRGARASGVVCPACRRPGVWWPLVPEGAGKAMCNRRQSCGWTGWLDELLLAHGVSLEVTA